MARPTPPLHEPAADLDEPWPPPVGATVVSPDGATYEIVGSGSNDQLGAYVVLLAWQTFPVNRAMWQRRGYRVGSPGPEVATT